MTREEVADRRRAVQGEYDYLQSLHPRREDGTDKVTPAMVLKRLKDRYGSTSPSWLRDLRIRAWIKDDLYAIRKRAGGAPAPRSELHEPTSMDASPSVGPGSPLDHSQDIGKTFRDHADSLLTDLGGPISLPDRDEFEYAKQHLESPEAYPKLTDARTAYRSGVAKSRDANERFEADASRRVSQLLTRLYDGIPDQSPGTPGPTPDEFVNRGDTLRELFIDLQAAVHGGRRLDPVARERQDPGRWRPVGVYWRVARPGRSTIAMLRDGRNCQLGQLNRRLNRVAASRVLQGVMKDAEAAERNLLKLRVDGARLIRDEGNRMLKGRLAKGTCRLCGPEPEPSQDQNQNVP